LIVGDGVFLSPRITVAAHSKRAAGPEFRNVRRIRASISVRLNASGVARDNIVHRRPGQRWDVSRAENGLGGDIIKFAVYYDGALETTRDTTTWRELRKIR